MGKSSKAGFLVLGVVMAVVGTGCPSLSTLQLPRTVPRGQVRFAFAPEVVGAHTTGDTATAPQTEFAIRYGVSDNIDVGAKLYLLGAEFGAKFMLLRGGLDLAVAPAASYFSFSSSSSGTSVSSSFLYLHLPIIFGANLNDSLTLGFGPKFMYVAGFGSASDTSSSAFASGNAMFAGLFVNLPIRVGDAFWIAPEINVYSNISNSGPAGAFDVTMFQGGLAFMFGGREANPDEPVGDAVPAPAPAAQPTQPAAAPAGYGDPNQGAAPAPPPTY